MKTFIRTLEFESFHEKEKIRGSLNGLGFYCLSFGDLAVDVFAISDDYPIDIELLSKIKEILK